jgi:hypothetical protein
MPRLGRRLTGEVSTRVGVFVAGYKTNYAVDPGLEDTIVPIATAQMNSLSRRVTSAISINHNNQQPISAFPQNVRNLVYENEIGNRFPVNRY